MERHAQAAMTRPLPDHMASALPPLYAAWMEQLLAGPIPQETGATCSDCVMLANESSPSTGSTHFFHPRVKCCTYLPELPNFLVGRILAETDPPWAAGRATVEARLRAGVAVTPLGLGRFAPYDLLYRHSVPAFGQSQRLRCPHYLEDEGGRCGIWRHRAGVCATWFCKYVRGAVGLRFWQALRQLLAAVETSLARWCVLELDVGSAALERLFPAAPEAGHHPVLHGDQLDHVVNPAEYRALWGTWAGREEAFFEACASRVQPLLWQEVLAIGGPELQLFARLTREAHQRLVSDEIPARLQVGSFEIVQMGSDACRVSSYSPFDALEVSTPLMAVLPYFDGRPTEEVRQAILDQEGTSLDDALIRHLVDFRLLVPGDQLSHEGEMHRDPSHTCAKEVNADK